MSDYCFGNPKACLWAARVVMDRRVILSALSWLLLGVPQIDPHLFCEPVRGYHAVARRYPRIYMPSDFTQVSLCPGPQRLTRAGEARILLR